MAVNSCRSSGDYPRQGEIYEVVEQKAKGTQGQQKKSVGGMKNDCGKRADVFLQ